MMFCNKFALYVAIADNIKPVIPHLDHMIISSLKSAKYLASAIRLLA